MSKFAILLLIGLFANQAVADIDTTKKTYQSCSVVASEVFTAIQLYQKKIDLESLYLSLPEITENGKERLKNIYITIAKEGVTETYSKANAQFSKCSKEAFKHQGKPLKNTLSYLFYLCSGENKLRYEIILSAYLGGSSKDIVPQIHPSRQSLGRYLFQIYEESGVNGAFDFSATELKRCLTQ